MDCFEIWDPTKGHNMYKNCVPRAVPGTDLWCCKRLSCLKRSLRGITWPWMFECALQQCSGRLSKYKCLKLWTAYFHPSALPALIFPGHQVRALLRQKNMSCSKTLITNDYFKQSLNVPNFLSKVYSCGLNHKTEASAKVWVWCEQKWTIK